ncbi:glycine cleavage H-protein-domain-containing protein [Pisolithus albus]|nr:glycine cleavage H-protein-domain-containing protein [Pisolithus albus]
MFSAIRSAARARTSLSLRTAKSSSVMFRTLVTTRYTKEHEAVAFDEETGIGTVSITEHAQQSLGDVVFVELPVVGSKVGKGDQIGAIESVKAASDIYAPVSGKVLEVNERLSDEPGLLNRSPEHDGWLCKIKLAEPGEVRRLSFFHSSTKIPRWKDEGVVDGGRLQGSLRVITKERANDR